MLIAGIVHIIQSFQVRARVAFSGGFSAAFLAPQAALYVSTIPFLRRPL